jgi:predicted DNA-binding transcriptional regulator YafY
MWEAAIASLLATSTIHEAADQCGVSERTLKRWLAMPEFQAAFIEAKSDMLKAATSKLRREAGAAVDVLSSVAGDTKAPAASRVTAGRALLELAFKSHETEVLEERIATLERSVGHGNR